MPVAAPTFQWRHFTKSAEALAGQSWQTREIVVPGGHTCEVEFPTGWSDESATIVVDKYFNRKSSDDAGAERSLRTLVDRIVTTIARWGVDAGYFASPDESSDFADELSFLLVNQRAAFNTPVWMNIGLRDRPQQSSGCFILSVDDTIDSILDWWALEATIFRGGSGSGVDLTRVRARGEPYAGNGISNGPIDFMRVADAQAAAIHSGGRNRSPAKMVTLDVSHPDALEFITLKVAEEHRRRKLALDDDLGVSMDAPWAAFQNTNHSVRLPDSFMHAVERDEPWEQPFIRGTAQPRVLRAREVFRVLAESAWDCGDPGVQFTTAIGDWHTCPNSGPIRSSNPCSEYLFLDDTACNLASLNIGAFWPPGRQFDVSGFCHAARVISTAQEILVDRSHYPSEKITEGSRRFRPIGLGFTNLAGALMRHGVAYDSERGRQWASTTAALLTGAAYETSAHWAEHLGPFDGFAENAAPMNTVIRRHAAAVEELVRSSQQQATGTRDLDDRDDGGLGLAIDASERLWSRVVDAGTSTGFRNSQATVVAPAGTISFVMDCDTTGIEPEFSLSKTKRLRGGGAFEIVSQAVRPGLAALGYAPDEIERLTEVARMSGSLSAADGLRPDHVAVFATAVGPNAVDPEGHIRMLGAVQPFISGGISKSLTLNRNSTAADAEALLFHAWRAGVKCLALYRDGSKAAQPLVSRHGQAAQQPINDNSCARCAGDALRPAGTCAVCPDCGTSSGCS